MTRFLADFNAVWPEGSPVGLAVSGGPDSLALLALAHAALLGRFEVATIDHGLRTGSADEAAMVAALCAIRGITHATLAVDVERSGNLQANARDARYRALERWTVERRLGALVTAHHLDDQAETLLMRLNRASGARGLAGMRPRAMVPGGTRPLLRPLLGWRRAELAAIVAAAGHAPIHDPANRNARFARARIRRDLAKAAWLDPAAIAASAAHLAETDAALAWASAQIYAQAEIAGGTIDWRVGETPRALALRVLERIVADLGNGSPRGSDLARWHDMLACGNTATLAGVRGAGGGAVWRFTRARPHRSPH